MTQKEECELLMQAIMPLAEHLLRRYKEFHPIGAVLNCDDTVALTAVYDGNEHPDSVSMIKDLVDVHRETAREGNIKVSGICWNSTISNDGKKEDAIVISLEHKEGYSVIVGETYGIGLFKRIKFGEFFALPGRHEVFSI